MTGRDPAACVVLVPVGGAVEPECARGLKELERRGYTVRRTPGTGATLDKVRSVMASRALADGFDELMWVDADVGFDADAVDVLRAHDLPVVCGIYAKKGPRALACQLLPGTERVAFGVGGGLLEIEYAGAGFLLTRREVYEKVAEHEGLPACDERFGHATVPYFLPLVRQDGDGFWYLGEDYAFCERARRSGVAVMADTTVRLWHVGRYAFGWEDAGGSLERFATYDFGVWR